MWLQMRAGEDNMPLNIPDYKDGEEQFQRKENDNPNRKTGLIGGVFKKGKKYQATIYYGGEAKYLGVGLNKTEEEVCVKSDPKQNFKEFFTSINTGILSHDVFKKRKQKLKNNLHEN
jgi:hypothetical protein